MDQDIPLDYWGITVVFCFCRKSSHFDRPHSEEEPPTADVYRPGHVPKHWRSCNHHQHGTATSRSSAIGTGQHLFVVDDAAYSGLVLSGHIYVCIFHFHHFIVSVFVCH